MMMSICQDLWDVVVDHVHSASVQVASLGAALHYLGRALLVVDNGFIAVLDYYFVEEFPVC